MSTSLGLYGNNRGFFASIMGRTFGLPQKLAPSHMGGQMGGRPWDNRQIEAEPQMSAAQPSAAPQVQPNAVKAPAQPGVPQAKSPVGTPQMAAAKPMQMQTQGFGRAPTMPNFGGMPTQQQGIGRGVGLLSLGARK